MSTDNHSHKRFLDGEALFRHYFENMGDAGSMAKLVNMCAAQGKKNPHTGKPPTRMGVWKAMWTWALLPENLKTSKDIFMKSKSTSGEFYTDAEWKELATTKAKGGVEFGKERYKKFAEALK